MASLKCLACGQDNKVGDESCTSCSSSLNLRLCSACEAINATSAERCHSCGAQFGPETEPASTLEEVADRAPSPGRVLPAAWIAGAEQATRRGWRAGAALWLLPIIAVASATYYFYDGAPHAAPAKQPTLEAKQVVLELAQPAPVVRQPPVAAAKPAPAAESGTSFEPKRALPPVTHTRLAAAATPAKPAPAAAVAASESAPALVERRGRVTHTRAEPAAAAEAGAAQAVAGASVPSTQARVEPAACPPEVVALGLCRSN